MNHCRICGAALASPLDTYGTDEVPLCCSCWLQPEEPEPAMFEYRDLGGGWLEKIITPYGAGLLGGAPGPVARIYPGNRDPQRG